MEDSWENHLSMVHFPARHEADDQRLVGVKTRRCPRSNILETRNRSKWCPVGSPVLVGWWWLEHFVIFLYIGYVIIPIDELVFFREVETTIFCIIFQWFSHVPMGFPMVFRLLDPAAGHSAGLSARRLHWRLVVYLVVVRDVWLPKHERVSQKQAINLPSGKQT